MAGCSGGVGSLLVNPAYIYNITEADSFNFQVGRRPSRGGGATYVDIGSGGASSGGGGSACECLTEMLLDWSELMSNPIFINAQLPIVRDLLEV